jgi:hypothetical protein
LLCINLCMQGIRIYIQLITQLEIMMLRNWKQTFIHYKTLFFHILVDRNYTNAMKNNWCEDIANTFSYMTDLDYVTLKTIFTVIVVIIIIIYCHVPAHPSKVKAFGYRTCHTTTCYNQQVVNRTMHINTSVNQAYKSSI